MANCLICGAHWLLQLALAVLLGVCRVCCLISLQNYKAFLGENVWLWRKPFPFICSFPLPFVVFGFCFCCLFSLLPKPVCQRTPSLPPLRAYWRVNFWPHLSRLWFPTTGIGTHCPTLSQPPWYLSVFWLSPAASSPVLGDSPPGHTSYSSVNFTSPLPHSVLPPSWADPALLHNVNRYHLHCCLAFVTSSGTPCSWRPGQLCVDVWGLGHCVPSDSGFWLSGNHS